MIGKIVSQYCVWYVSVIDRYYQHNCWSNSLIASNIASKMNHHNPFIMFNWSYHHQPWREVLSQRIVAYYLTNWYSNACMHRVMCMLRCVVVPVVMEGRRILYKVSQCSSNSLWFNYLILVYASQFFALVQRN